MNKVPSSLSNYSTHREQVIYLEKLRNDVKVLNPDRIIMINLYLSQTGIKTNIVETLVTMRNFLAINSDSSLYRKYRNVTEQFSRYLGDRITQLNSSSACHHIDPWLELSTQTKETRQQGLEDMSHHIQDVLFHCDMVTNFELEEGVKNAIHELIELQKHIEGDYHVTLSEATKPNKSIENLFAELPEKLKLLKKHFDERKFENAKSILVTIHNQLKIHSDSLAKQ